MSSDIIISARNLSKTYRAYAHPLDRFLPARAKRCKEFHALNDVSFDIKRGETVGIIGRNGSGKSTLLQLICGIRKPTSGTLQVNGRISALLELGAGFHPEFTGRENVFLQGAIQGMSRQEMEARFDDIAAFADIGEYIDQPVKTYSSGMFVRLAFAVAVSVEPDILVVDEALAVGDAAFRAKGYARLNKLRDNGTTLLLVTHAMDEVCKHCDRAIFLKSGVMLKDGSSRETTNFYLEELFGKRAKEKTNPSGFPDAERVFLLDAQEEFHLHPGYKKEESRSGQGGASIVDYLIYSNGQKHPSKIKSNDRVDFYVRVRFSADFHSVVPGLLIKTIEGLYLYGTNSLLATSEHENAPVMSGDVRVFKFSVLMNLNAGHYLVSFGVSSGLSMEGLVPLDRRYDSVLIEVDREEPFLGLVDMQSSFVILDGTPHGQ